MGGVRKGVSEEVTSDLRPGGGGVVPEQRISKRRGGNGLVCIRLAAVVDPVCFLLRAGGKECLAGAQRQIKVEQEMSVL